MNKSAHRAQILLDPQQHQALVQIARREKRSLSDLVREMLDQQLAERKQHELSAAAHALLEDYQPGGDLTVFTALDSEDFHA
jgi:hypothetical protein